MKLIIKKEDELLNIREYLSLRYHVGRSNIHKLFINKCLLLNGEIKPFETHLKENDVIEIDFKDLDHLDYLPYNYNLDILYEDEYILIINKPSGYIIYPETKDLNKTVVNMVANYYQKRGLDISVRYIHRLDKETSGVMVFAKDFITMSALEDMLEKDKITREYIAFVKGIIKESHGIIEKPIGRNRHERNKYLVTKNGDYAKTTYEVLKRYNTYTKIKCILSTGRTHQIRVHMLSIGHPLIGDELYGSSSNTVNRLALHSSRIYFKHPITSEQIDITAPIPKELEILDK